MNLRTGIACAALLCVACGGAEPTAREADAARPSGLLATLTDVAERLDAVAGEAEGSVELEQLPSWCRLGHYKLRAPGDPEPDLAALRGIVSGDQPPRIRGLAALWLATAEQIGDLELFDALLDAPEPAGSFPSVQTTQDVRPSYPVTWHELTLGQVALDAAGTVIGRGFEDVAEYRRWRAEQGDLESSVAYWEGMLEGPISPEERAEKLATIRERDRVLLVRMVLTADESHRALYDVDDTEIESSIAELYDAAALERLLRRQERWPEFKDPARFGRFAEWIFDHFEAITRPEDRGVLLELWESWPCPDENWVRRNLALAIARNHPDRRDEILLAVLEERPTTWMADVFTELLENGLGDHLDAIDPWFFVSDSMSDDDNRASIIRALSKGPTGKADLNRLVSDKRFSTDSPRVIQALIEAARELGAEIECGESLKPVGTGKVLEQAKHRPREITPEDEQRAADARAACLERILRWLRGK
jgi:hypothetical protein